MEERRGGEFKRTPATSATLSPRTLSRSEGHRSLALGLSLVAGLVASAGCGESPSAPSSHPRSPVVARPAPTVIAHAKHAGAVPKTSQDGSLLIEAPMPPGVHVDPDPNIRLDALEAWALAPRQTLDPVTYALVDPDESVRARAQELFEEVLARW